MDDLLTEFLTETGESLATLDVELVKLEQNPSPQILSNIFRLVHTIKGTCGFLGLPRLEAVAHAGENVLGKIRDGEITATIEQFPGKQSAMGVDMVAEFIKSGKKPDQQITLLTPAVITKENLNEAERLSEAK